MVLSWWRAVLGHFVVVQYDYYDVTSVFFSGSKYCPMLVRECGVEMLKDLLATYQWNPYISEIRQLAQCIISRCERFAADNDYVTDDEQMSSGTNE